MGEQLNQKRLQFFTRCIDTLKKKLPRVLEVPSLKANSNWQWIYKPIDEKVYFEWQFSTSDFRVNLFFETDDGDRNKKLLDMFRPMKQILEKRLGTKLTYDDQWKRGGVMWARLYVSTPILEMTPELEAWAVEKARILIEECEPLFHGKVAADQNSTGELPTDVEFVEPAVTKVLVNRYERNREARVACLKAHGHTCTVCVMTFSRDFGEIGDEFIHVHHRKPRSLTKTAYKLDPVADLEPVCPNCHAMLHYGRPWDSPRSTDELRKIRREHGNG